MSALAFARHAFGREKPHSSTTDWIDILTANNVEEEAYDGIPELVDSINLQAAGPAEASRALRKKLKHGNPHQQYRALVLLKALVENCGQKFQTTFADGQLTDAIRNLASDSGTDKRVKKKLLLVLASWRDQFKSEPSMSLVAGLYKQCSRSSRAPNLDEIAGISLNDDKKKTEKEEAKRKARQEKEETKEKARREEEERRQAERNRQTRAPFIFDKEKPKILTSIVDASQASSNLINAIKLVNTQNDSLETNERVQDCLEKTKKAKKAIVRYIQLVEHEELIGTLIETNERAVAAIQMYDGLKTQEHKSADGTSPTMSSGPGHPPPERGDYDSQERYSAEMRNAAIHPDLEDLSFGPLGGSSTNLPPPLHPSTRSDDGRDHRGSLSDFSDYESSNEETHTASSRKRGGKEYFNVSDDDNFTASRSPHASAEADPFADPFADEVAVGTIKTW